VGHAVLGHRRLAIFDLSELGRQPMLSPDRQIALVFNGAIYNFVELRDQLIAKGYRFISASDTEVLIHGYREWGIEGLVERLRGMFTIALWDAATETLHLVRDRLGVKPLLYVERDGAVAFASTVRALRAAGLVEDIDAEAVAEFLEFGFVTERRSIYRGARKVPPATIVTWRDGASTSRRYWNSPQARESGNGHTTVSFDDAVATTERLLLQAVERRLQADVPVGALLSGGIDSALVCWAIRELGGDITAFTVGAPGSAADETPDATATARELGIRHVVLPLSDTSPIRSSELVAAFAEPFASSSAVGLIRVSEVIRPSATVLLTGDGGDDLFLGYARHRHLLAAQRTARWLPLGARPAWRAARSMLPDRGTLGRAKHFADYAVGGLGAFLAVGANRQAYVDRGILGPRLQAIRVADRERPWSRASAQRALADYLAYDLETQFVSEYLTKVDGATMYHALEARSPFFDQELWEYGSSLPVSLRLRGGELKAVLRELARRRVSSRVAAGRKRGFTVPVEEWMATRWRDVVRESFRDSALATDGWIDSSAVIRTLDDEARSGRVSTRLWYLYVLEEWMKAERVQTSATTPASVLV
jgi:asparagine synthase (glutamine-hydrolysing)